MFRLVLQRMLVCLAFAAALLAPAFARAAILPACENRELFTAMPAPPPPPVENDQTSACVLPLLEEGGDSKVAAMCDLRGASAIAPQRLLPVSDARLESTPQCNGEVIGPMIGPAQKQSPALGAQVTLANHAMLPGQAMVPPPASELLPAYPPVTGAERAGIARTVYHPPR